MTATTTQPVPAVAPRWSATHWRLQDRTTVLDLFTEADFYFRTELPDTRSEREILALLGDDTRVLLADGELAGLYALENLGSEQGCSYVLRLRLRAGVPARWWCSAYEQIVCALRWRSEVVRLAMQFHDFDTRGLAFARSLGITEEGTLGALTVHDRRRRGQVWFARIWEPA